MQQDLLLGSALEPAERDLYETDPLRKQQPPGSLGVAAGGCRGVSSALSPAVWPVPAVQEFALEGCQLGEGRVLRSHAHSHSASHTRRPTSTASSGATHRRDELPGRSGYLVVHGEALRRPDQAHHRRAGLVQAAWLRWCSLMLELTNPRIRRFDRFPERGLTFLCPISLLPTKKFSLVAPSL
jgi:hypothetical protein